MAPRKGSKNPPAKPEPTTAPSPPARALVVGMGASAGGLEALQKFFAHMAADSGMAFVIVQHLDPRHATLLPELLEKATPMSVEQIKDETPVHANHVYVIPPNAALTIEGGILRIRPPVETRGIRTPIDGLFHSLAEDQGQNAVCILLSGSGSDGTLGLRAVKEHGGMAMAQSPESAQHDGILRSAISTGLVDHVLPPEEMPQKLQEYAIYLGGLEGRTGLDAFVAEAGDKLVQITTILRKRTGHDFSQYKPSTLVRRIQRRMGVLQFATVATYLKRLREDPKEVEQLFRDLLIGVTHFFRDPDAFDVLARDVVPRLVELAATDGALRVWTPGCATGEEAYSIAMLVKEEMQRRDVRPRVQIFACDIDDEALEFARQARYPEGIVQHVSPERLERFFTRENHGYHLAKEIREMCIFSTHNLIKDPPFSRLDLIVCRNVLIYLESDLQRYVSNLFHYALHRGGYLFLGPSENVAGPPELFRTLDRKHRIYQRSETLTRPHQPIPLPIPPGAAHRTAGTRGVTPPPSRQGRPELLMNLERVLLEEYAPAWVVINADAQVLYYSARTGRFLEAAAGAPNNDIISMARRGLRLDLRTGIHKAVKTGTAVTHEDVAVETNGDVQRINLLIRPLNDLGVEGGLYLVVFQELGPPKSKEAAAEERPSARTGDALVQQLESELRSTKEHLQVTVEEVETSNEELKSSNEELLSTNEELQSANEELQTSKEEMQSVNEELETINAELNKKVEELDRVNSDLVNLFQGTRIPTIFLDNALRIKRFTPAAMDVFRLIETDVGRSIADIAPRFLGELVEDMKDVLRSLATKERQVRLADASAMYVVRMLPYRRVDNVIDGLVMTFFDITQLERLQAQRATLAAVVQSSQDAIVSRTFDGKIISWNEGAERIFGYSEQEAVGSSMSLILPPDQRAELERTEADLRRGQRIAPFESIRVAKGDRRIPVSVAVSPLRDETGALVGSSAVIRDLTDLKRAQSIEEEGRRKDRFLAVLSHELRGPLGSLRIAVDILQSHGAGGEHGHEALEIADRQLEHLAAMVDQLLDASRIASGRAELKFIDQDLVEVVRTSVEDQRGMLIEAEVELKTDFPREPLFAHCDPLRVSQVVVNLLTNAAKFTESGGTVTVKLSADPEAHEAVLSVRDTGVGIESSAIPYLFASFSLGNAPNARSRAGSGLGLGLALVRSLVEAHGGKVEGRSEGKGKGAEFVARFPLLRRDEDDGAAKGGADSAGVAGEPRRVLVVEDVWDAAEGLRRMLTLAGHTVDVAPDGKTALAKLRNFRPEVVVCDIGLPGDMDGYAVAAAIRKDPEYGSPYLIALTGYGLPADKEKAIEAGFDKHITKAERPRTLLRALAGVPRKA